MTTHSNTIAEFIFRDPFVNKSLIEALKIPEDKVTDSMRSIDSLYRRFCENIYDTVSLNGFIPTKLAVTDWVYGQGEYDICFKRKDNVCVKTFPESSIRRIGQRDIIIQDIENVNNIGILKNLEGIDKKVNRDITYYDLPGGYKSILNGVDPYFSNIRSVMLRYVTGNTSHTANAVRRDSENFIFISDKITATQKINSWTDLHKVADVFISKSYPQRVYYVCPERVLYDFGNANQ